MTESLCGVWVDDVGIVHVCLATPEGARVEKTDVLRPFAWLNGHPASVPVAIKLEDLSGAAPYARLAHAQTLEAYESFIKSAKATVGVDAVRPLENQFHHQPTALSAMRVRLKTGSWR